MIYVCGISNQLIKVACITGRDVTVRNYTFKIWKIRTKHSGKFPGCSRIWLEPLARIMGLTNLLKTSRYDDFDETIDFIQLSAHELDHIINKITEESSAIIDKYPVPTDLDAHKN